MYIFKALLVILLSLLPILVAARLYMRARDYSKKLNAKDRRVK